MILEISSLIEDTIRQDDLLKQQILYIIKDAKKPIRPSKVKGRLEEKREEFQREKYERGDITITYSEGKKAETEAVSL